ncbi:TRAP transporter substrate-binding protein DctP [Marinobacter sp. M216]|uniref:TRAP transporter substrate-binding protein DctP n=1 Tax=Marinobacter albus TaxID=3030833 RepID=A0ABT7HB37_9GAMM|nr:MULTISPECIES: TRAP transporter substrate-binding protein DctP [unclassified Marinobacter]MBW7470642.1 TRAP transporter substrate-binding protein DctP [Marinobacter sp. F4218]MDK9557090.1 TRAP transporter substrate-binding protein DctP [Marinobacter sp. M216]
MRTTSLRFSFLAILFALMAGCSESEPTSAGSVSPEAEPPEYPVTWRFALEEIEGSVQHAYAEALKESIEELSDGKILLDIFPYGSLGTSAQLTELAKNGSVNLAFASPGHLADQIPEVGVFTLHYLLSDDGEVNRQLLASPELMAMFETPYASRNLKLLAFVPEGWMAWTANKPLRTPADFEGLRIRTMTSDMAAATYRAYGAKPSQTPYSQVYSDLQLRQIDAQTNPIFAIEEMNFYEVQSTLTDARPAQFISSLVTNGDWYKALPAKQQQWLDSALAEVAEVSWKTQEELNQTRLESMLEAGDIKVVRLTESERAAFAEASKPVHQDYMDATGERGSEILKRIRQLVETLESRAQTSPTENGG